MAVTSSDEHGRADERTDEPSWDELCVCGMSSEVMSTERKGCHTPVQYWHKQRVLLLRYRMRSLGTAANCIRSQLLAGVPDGGNLLCWSFGQ